MDLGTIEILKLICIYAIIHPLIYILIKELWKRLIKCLWGPSSDINSHSQIIISSQHGDTVTEVTTDMESFQQIQKFISDVPHSVWSTLKWQMNHFHNVVKACVSEYAVNRNEDHPSQDTNYSQGNENRCTMPNPRSIYTNNSEMLEVQTNDEDSLVLSGNGQQQIEAQQNPIIPQVPNGTSQIYADSETQSSSIRMIPPSNLRNGYWSWLIRRRCFLWFGDRLQRKRTQQGQTESDSERCARSKHILNTCPYPNLPSISVEGGG